MAEIIRLNNNEIEMAEDFLDHVKSGYLTHGVICYRTKEGTVNYQLYSPKHLTYIIGMIEICKNAMIHLQKELK